MEQEDQQSAEEWETLALEMANDALPYRVKGREWETALLVARRVLKWVDKSRMVPMKDALQICISQLNVTGFLVVRAEEARELLAAMDAFGMDKEHTTDSAALRRVKTALRNFRLSRGLM